MLRMISAAIVAATLASPLWAKSFAEMYPDLVDQLAPEDLALVEPLDFQQGKITIGNDLATLDISEGYYYLSPEDAAHVLEQIWENPPGDLTLGMVFPAETSPLHGDGWGMTLRFDEIGYVSDEDADEQDYDKILRDLQAETRENSKWRVENGYGSVDLVGWAEVPSYDTENKVLYWAKELSFGGSDTNTLNFNMRVLGRKGVLVENFIADIGALERVKADLPDVIAMTSFNAGNTYAEFDSSIDKVAAIGIGGLVAGKVLAKTGLLAVALVFLKKAGFLLLLPLFWLKNLFGRRKPGEAADSE